MQASLPADSGQLASRQASAGATGSTAGGQQLAYNFKVVLLGEGCVGKTSLVLRYVDDRFNPSHITTLQASFLAKKLNIAGKRVSLSIWDTAGQERFHALGPIYYRSSNGALLVYDVTDEDSFRKVKNWVRELQRQLGSDIVLTIVGNKIDLQSSGPGVPAAEADAYAQSVGARHFHTSAKDNVGVEELFYELATMMIERSDARQRQLAAAAGAAGQSGSLRRTNSRRSAAGGGLLVEGALGADGAVIVDASEAAGGAASRCCGGGGGGGGGDRG